jgi:hypothetical protein
MRKLILRTAAIAPLLLATPAFAAPLERLTLVDVFGNAAGPIKLIALLLLAAVVVAPCSWPSAGPSRCRPWPRGRRCWAAQPYCSS